EMFRGESITFQCSVDVSVGWEYLWYRNGQEIPAANDNKYTITSVTHSDNGKYRCKSKRGKDKFFTEESEPTLLRISDVILTQDPEYKVMFPGESVSFSCHINVSSGWEYLWFKDGSPLVGSESKYPINPVGATSGGSYTCRVKRGSNRNFTTDSSQALHLEVDEKKPKPLMTQQPDADKLYTGEPVSFECKVTISSGWTYHWYKDGASLLSDSSSFRIDNATLLNNGNYECKAIRSRTMFNTERSDGRTLLISEIPVPSLKKVTQWLDVFPTEGVKFSCEMPTSSDWTYTWYKDTKVQTNASMTYGQDKSTLTIHSASPSHRGNYSCSAKLKIRSVKTSRSSELRLDVYGEIFFFIFDSDKPINTSRSVKYKVTPSNDPDQSSYKCQGIRTGRPTYSKISTSHKTKNLRKYDMWKPGVFAQQIFCVTSISVCILHM
uniref:Titin-like n=1 Tax=Acanthochromis polyacanthus TaxID=80966 RepID=A0A3Q1FIM8_9TELE